MSTSTIAERATDLYKQAHITNVEVTRQEIITMIIKEFNLDTTPKGKMKASNYYTTAKKKASIVVKKSTPKATKTVTKVVYPSDYAVMYNGDSIDNIKAVTNAKALKEAKAKWGPKVTVSKY